MASKAKVIRWFRNAVIGGTSVAGVLVLLAGIVGKDLSYEPGFLAAASGILILVHSITKTNWAAVPAGFFAIGSGVLWMRTVSEDPGSMTVAVVTFISVLAVGLVIFGMITFYVWLSDRGGKSGVSEGV